MNTLYYMKHNLLLLLFELWVKGISGNIHTHTKGTLMEFRGQGRVFWTGILKAWRGIYDWESIGIGGEVGVGERL